MYDAIAPIVIPFRTSRKRTLQFPAGIADSTTLSAQSQFHVNIAVKVRFSLRCSLSAGELHFKRKARPFQFAHDIVRLLMRTFAIFLQRILCSVI